MCNVGLPGMRDLVPGLVALLITVLESKCQLFPALTVLLSIEVRLWRGSITTLVSREGT